MNKIIYRSLLCLLIYSCEQKIKKNEEPRLLDSKSTEIVSNFFAKIESGNYSNAIDELLSSNNNIDMKDSLTINLKNKFININEKSGKFISYRLLRKQILGDDLGVYSYLVKYNNKFYRFLLTFYNNEKEVNIYKFSFDDTVDLELEEALRLYVN